MLQLPIVQGIGFGLLVAVLLGPVFFALIQTSITKGFPAGTFMALGILLSDAFCVFISFFGLLQFVQDPQTLRWIGIFGGLFMVGYGAFLTFNQKVRAVEDHLPEMKTGRALGGSLAKGFLLNLLNPFVIVYWLGVSSLVSAIPEFDRSDKVLFFTGTLGTILVTDLLKSYGAKKLRRHVTRSVILWLNRISGSVLLLFGLKILVDVFVYQKNFTL
jgi:threonine/homoserine/homoserine lactone efflux protein